MALLIDVRQPEWMTEEALGDVLAPHLPGVPIYCGFDGTPRPDVIMLATVKLHKGVVRNLPNLQAVQKLGAGVDAIVSDPDLGPDVIIARLSPDTQAREIAEFCLAYVMRAQRNIAFHEAHECNAEWVQVAPRQTETTTVGVLGLGHIGGWAARMFAGLGFRVLGWSRSLKHIDGVECRHGENALPELLGECDYVASILPSTPATRNLLDAATLAHMKPGSMLINAGRGDLVVEDDLLAAIGAGRPGSAVLDVFRSEPLPAGHPFWSHDRITVTPHVSGWSLGDGMLDIAENYKRLVAGKPLLHVVSREAGY